jgi:hypothetical protein
MGRTWQEAHPHIIGFVEVLEVEVVGVWTQTTPNAQVETAGGSINGGVVVRVQAVSLEAAREVLGRAIHRQHIPVMHLVVEAQQRLHLEAQAAAARQDPAAAAAGLLATASTQA